MGLYKIITDRYQQNASSAEETKSKGLLKYAEELLSSESPVSSENISAEPAEPAVSEEETPEAAVQDEAVSEDKVVFADEPLMFFHNFAEEVGLSKACVLMPYKNGYKMFFSVGFDTNSLNKSFSTADFWDGALKTDDWFCYSNEKLTPFFQLFSSNDIEDIKHLHIRRLIYADNKTCIFIVAEESTTPILDSETLDMVLPSITECLEKADSVIKSYNIEIKKPVETELNKTIASATDEGFTGNKLVISPCPIYRQIFELASENDLYVLFSCMISKLNEMIKAPDVFYFTPEHEIRLIIFSKNEFDSDIYAAQLKNAFSNIFSENKADLLSVTSEGKSSSKFELSDFIFRCE